MVYPTFMADHPGLSVEEAMKAQMHETLIAEKVFIGDQDALGGGGDTGNGTMCITPAAYDIALEKGESVHQAVRYLRVLDGSQMVFGRGQYY